MNSQQRATLQVSHFTNRISVPELLTLTRHAHQWLADEGGYTRGQLEHMTADEKLAEIDYLYSTGLKGFSQDQGVGK
jgi:hypothetical protein